jgi:hypothetical protein
MHADKKPSEKTGEALNASYGRWFITTDENKNITCRGLFSPRNRGHAKLTSIYIDRRYLAKVSPEASEHSLGYEINVPAIHAKSYVHWLRQSDIVVNDLDDVPGTSWQEKLRNFNVQQQSKPTQHTMF